MQRTDENAAEFINNAYREILPEYIKSVSEVQGSFAEVFSCIARLFETVMDLSHMKAGFAIFWSDNINYGGKLSVPYFNSPTIPAEKFEKVLSAVAELLVLDPNGGIPRTYDKSTLLGYMLAIPIYANNIAYGYAVVFYDETRKDDPRFHDIGSPLITFLSNAMYFTAVIIEEQSSSKRFEHYVMNDYLTDLPNRTYIYESMVFSLQTAEISGNRFALMIVRINGLKHINNSLGILVGDLMLKEMGHLIKFAVESVHPDVQTLVGRLSGGDFAVMLTYPAAEKGIAADKEILKAHCEAIIAKTRDPVMINEYKLYQSVSIGASIFPYHGETPEALLRRADLAKSAAKLAGMNNYQIYDDLMEGTSDKMLFLSNNLPVAIESNQFELFYQAQADAATGIIKGAEALIRWRHPERGMISPGDFIAYAEDNGYGIQIDRLVLDMACDQIKKWSDKGYNLSVSVNISPKHFANGLIYDTMSKILSRTEITPSGIKIELLESVLLEDFEVAIKVIESVQALGIPVALDDFGSGYSSLEYIARLPLDYLKVDRTFAMNLDQRPSNKTILKTIMTLAGGMGVKTIIEGVETQNQLDFLKSIGADLVQGYFINKPMPAADFEVLIEKNKKEHADQLKLF